MQEREREWLKEGWEDMKVCLGWRGRKEKGEKKRKERGGGEGSSQKGRLHDDKGNPQFLVEVWISPLAQYTNIH